MVSLLLFLKMGQAGKLIFLSVSKHNQLSQSDFRSGACFYAKRYAKRYASEKTSFSTPAAAAGRYTFKLSTKYKWLVN